MAPHWLHALVIIIIIMINALDKQHRIRIKANTPLKKA